MPNGTGQSSDAEPPGPDDPETLLAEFAEEMRRELAAVKERAVQALQERNRLRRALVEAEELEARGPAAGGGRAGDLASAAGRCEALREELARAEADADAVIQEIRDVQERLRVRIADRLTLITQWSEAEIKERVAAVCSGLSHEAATEAFERARARIRDLDERSKARLQTAAAGLKCALDGLSDQRPRRDDFGRA